MAPSSLVLCRAGTARHQTLLASSGLATPLRAGRPPPDSAPVSPGAESFFVGRPTTRSPARSPSAAVTSWPATPTTPGGRSSGSRPTARAGSASRTARRSPTARCECCWRSRAGCWRSARPRGPMGSAQGAQARPATRCLRSPCGPHLTVSRGNASPIPSRQSSGAPSSRRPLPAPTPWSSSAGTCPSRTRQQPRRWCGPPRTAEHGGSGSSSPAPFPKASSRVSRPPRTASRRSGGIPGSGHPQARHGVVLTGR